MQPIKNYFKYPDRILLALLKRAGGRALPDRLYLQWYYRLHMGRRLDLDNPRTLNEKIQWLKLYNRRPEYTRMVDKLEAKRYVAARIGEEYVIPTLGVWDRPEDICWDELPGRFVLKTTHGGGGTGVVVCRDKDALDRKSAVRRLRTSMGDDIYRTLKEWPYKDVPRRVIAEQYLDDGSGEALVDYKFYCFGGKAGFVMTCTGRGSGDTKFYFFDREWRLRRYNKMGKEAPEGFSLPKPENMDRMFDIAETLSEDFPFVRIDLYNVEGRIYFGEYTFYPASGFDKGRLPESDILFGDMVSLPEKMR